MKHNTRHLIANLVVSFAIAGIAGVGAAACSSGSADTIVPGDTNVQAPAVSDDDTDNTAMFDTLVNQQGVTDTATAETRAKAVCAKLDAGEDTGKVIIASVLAPAPFTAQQQGFIIGAGTEAFCPSHSDAVQAVAQRMANLGN